MEYQWIKSNRKTMVIQVRAHGEVVVRSPYRVTKVQVESFLRDKKDWIKQQQQRILEEERLQLVITDDQRCEGLKKAGIIIPQRVAYYAGLMGVHYGRITLREQKTRWGSCSSKGNLNFNWKLVLMPSEVLDYVVVHELAHLKEMNHSPKFWAIVEQIIPDYRMQREKLKNCRL